MAKGTWGNHFKHFPFKFLLRPRESCYHERHLLKVSSFWTLTFRLSFVTVIHWESFSSMVRWGWCWQRFTSCPVWHNFRTIPRAGYPRFLYAPPQQKGDVGPFSFPGSVAMNPITYWCPFYRLHPQIVPSRTSFWRKCKSMGKIKNNHMPAETNQTNLSLNINRLRNTMVVFGKWKQCLMFALLIFVWFTALSVLFCHNAVSKCCFVCRWQPPRRRKGRHKAIGVGLDALSIRAPRTCTFSFIYLSASGAVALDSCFLSHFVLQTTFESNINTHFYKCTDAHT